MSHTNSTVHYDLPQFVSTDKPTYLGDSNSAYLAIDNGINAAQAKADGADAKATENTGKITQLQADLTQANQQISTVQQIANNANSTAISANDLANAMSKDGAIDTTNLANKAVTSEKIDWTTLTRTVSLSADATVNANTPVLSLTVPAGTWLIIATGRWYQGGLANGIYRIVLDEQAFITNESTPDGTIRFLRGFSLVRTYTSSHTINLMTDMTVNWSANGTNLTALKIG